MKRRNEARCDNLSNDQDPVAFETFVSMLLLRLSSCVLVGAKQDLQLSMVMPHKLAIRFCSRHWPAKESLPFLAVSFGFGCTLRRIPRQLYGSQRKVRQALSTDARRLSVSTSVRRCRMPHNRIAPIAHFHCCVAFFVQLCVTLRILKQRSILPGIDLILPYLN